MKSLFLSFLITVSFGVMASPVSVPAFRETDPMFHNDDAADDMAIWVNRADRSKSVIIGTDKGGGIGVFNLDGQMQSYSSVGKVNNIDIRQDFFTGTKSFDVLVASNVTLQTVDVYVYKPSLYSLVKRGSVKIDVGPSKVYGICLGKRGNFLDVFVSIKTGNVFHYELTWAKELNEFQSTYVRTIPFDSTTEGCVVDEANGVVFIGEEEKGIWKVPLEGGEKTMIQPEGPPYLVGDIEGLALYRDGNGGGYLIASSQGNHTYTILERKGEHKILKNFKIVSGTGVDGTTKTDGIAVTSLALGSDFPQGLFVAQDNDNEDSRGRLINQNFKLVRWEDIATTGDVVLDVVPQ